MRDRPHVFLSYATADREAAKELYDRLAQSGAAPFLDRVDLELGAPILSASRSQLAAADFLVLLLSPEALASEWVHHELEYAVSTELRQRSITLVPVKVKPCRVPDYLAAWTVIDATGDLRKAISKVVSLLETAPLVRLEKLSPTALEAFVGDLLKAYGFRKVKKALFVRDVGFDFSAQSIQRDPFGRTETVDWLVQVKAAKGQADTSSLQAFLGILSLRKERGLFITTGQLTSPARGWLEHLSRSSTLPLNLIEGTELRRLAIAKPRVVRKHFPETEGKS